MNLPPVQDTSSPCSTSPSTSGDDTSTAVVLASENPKKPAGRRKFRETRHPVYRGVRRRGSAKWVCEVREPKKKTRIWLGTFPTPEMAARAHDVAAMALRGPSACLNFADSAWRLPLPASAAAKDIQKAAAQAAEAFRPSLTEEAVIPAFMDEEAVFGMHGLLMSMAEGLMLPPPLYNDDVETYSDVSLWNY